MFSLSTSSVLKKIKQRMFSLLFSLSILKKIKQRMFSLLFSLSTSSVLKKIKQGMFSLSTSSVLSTYSTFATSAFFIRTVLNEVQNLINLLVPIGLREKIMSKLGILMGNPSSTMCRIINEANGFPNSEIFEAAETYLKTRISPSVNQLVVSKSPGEKNLSITMDKGEEIVDNFDGTVLTWKLACTGSNEKVERKLFELRFDKKFQDKVLNSYLPFVLKESKRINEENKVVRLHTLGYGGIGGSVDLDHPATFDTLAMDPTVKKELIDDLNRFVNRKDFYRRVGKAWKRGYLLYGPPGTGKSSLVAAMATHLKFDVYDLELKSLRDRDFKALLVSTKNRSILVIEDIDCSINLENRQDKGSNATPTANRGQLTLSGLLNFIDGLWSSCGDERIIIFTTNHKDRLDPALLRPGRMDMHIHMSYCTFIGFKILASNYLQIKSHSKFEAIERMIAKVEVTPAEIAEELMKSEDVEIALDKVVELLCKKGDQSVGEIKDVAEEKEEEIKEEGEKKVTGKKEKKQTMNKE